MISFEKRGWLSIWVGWSSKDKGKDTLKDLCGVDYYDVDFQESVISKDWQPVPPENLLSRLSYASSFLDMAVKAAQSKDIDKISYAVMQLNFKYDLRKVTRPIAEDPVFLGAFRWSK